MRKFASELGAVGVGLPGQPGDQDQCHSSNFELFLLCLEFGTSRCPQSGVMRATD